MLLPGAGKMHGNDFGEIDLVRLASVLKLGLVYTVASTFNLDILPMFGIENSPFHI